MVDFFSEHSILTSILTGIISSLLFYIIFEYIPSVKQAHIVISLIRTSYYNAKISILFEFANIHPHHTAYELIINHPITLEPIDFNEHENLDNYDLLRECFKDKSDQLHSESEYCSPYAISIIRNLCRVLDFSLSQQIIITDSELTENIVTIRNTLLECIENNDDNAYQIIQYFIFGGTFGIWTTPQLHRFMRSGFDNEGKDLFIKNLEKKRICWI